MDNSLLVSLSQQLASFRAMDVIANNLANASTPGFKREAAKFEEYVAHVRPSEDQKGAQSVSFVKDAGILRDLSQGSVEHTGATYDLAINGKGYFVIQTPQGERYTRDGHFSLNQDGVVVTANGQPLLGDGGAVTITPDDSNVQFGPDGTISSTVNGLGNQVGKLRIVDFPNERLLNKQGANLYAAPPGQTPATAENATVAQGMLEGSNVAPVIEISHMIEVMRAYEATASLSSSQEELLRNAIDKLGQMPN
ncbi:MAG TPA: flagellar basal-body rod protein FlgF [Rhizomicrobium sp.]|jgi:flagellar basal-body rod protein FlgF|nr:flagellar basal-body rod protein FlgF [Rhizomicrobium sp.]